MYCGMANFCYRVFFLSFLQLNKIACEMERLACESGESWFIKSAPLSSIDTSDLRLIGSDSFWQLEGNEPLKLNPF